VEGHLMRSRCWEAGVRCSAVMAGIRCRDAHARFGVCTVRVWTCPPPVTARARRCCARPPLFLRTLEARAGLVALVLDVWRDAAAVAARPTGKLDPGARPAMLAPGTKVVRGPDWRCVLGTDERGRGRGRGCVACDWRVPVASVRAVA
jgi:hypothetical protein